MSKSPFKTLVVGIIVSIGWSFVPCPYHYQHRVREKNTNVGLDSNDEDTNFYRDLREAKKSKLGSEIPKDQLKESASSSELEFLEAMKQAKKEFQDAKEEYGFDGAVDMIIGKLREEDSGVDSITSIDDNETRNEGL